jgi:hypothetical protein
MPLGFVASKPGKKFIYVNGSPWTGFGAGETVDTVVLNWATGASGAGFGSINNPVFTGITLTVSTYVWDGKTLQYFDSVKGSLGPSASASLQLLLPKNDAMVCFRYSIEATDSTAPVTSPLGVNFGLVVNYNAQSMTNYGYLHFKPMGDVTRNLTITNTVRNIGTGVLLSNRANKLTQGGSVAAIQRKPDTWFQDVYTGVDPYDTLDNLNGHINKTLSTGIHGAIHPVDGSYFDFSDNYSYADGELTKYEFNMMPREGFIQISTLLPTVTDGAVYANSFNCEIGNSIEYVTEDNWRETELPNISTIESDAANDNVKYVPQFHDNPNHVADIFSKIAGIAKTAIPWLVKEGPGLFNMAKAAFA